MSDKIVSLCYVSSKNDRTTELCRIADLIDGDFYPYYFEPGNEFYGNNRDLIYGSTTFLQVEEGSIAVFEWMAYLNEQNKWFTETSKVDQPWCEVVLTRYETCGQIIEALKKGYARSEGYDRHHDLIFCCNTLGNKYDALYVSASDSTFRDNKVFLLDNVVSLSQVTVDRSAICSCKCRSSKYDPRKYLSSQYSCRVIGSLAVKEKDELIGEIIRQNIGKDALGRKERQAARTALEKLSLPTITDMISERLHCTSSEAQRYAESYISKTKEKLDNMTALYLIDLLIENDSGSVQRMRESVQKQWENEQYELIAAAQEREKKERSTLDNLHEKISEETTKLNELHSKQAEVEGKIEEVMILQEQLEEEIKKRLEEFKTQYASMLINNAITDSILSTKQNSKVEKSFNNLQDSSIISIPDNKVQVGALADNIEEAFDLWKNICYEPDMIQGLVIFSFAAYEKKQPLLIVGEGCTEIADLISSSVCGQSSIKILMNNDCHDIEYIKHKIEEAPKAAICFENGLKQGYDQLRVIMHEYPERMFFVTEIHAETLLMEPVSLFTVFLPVFCDYFYKGFKDIELPIFDCSDELHSRLEKIVMKNQLDAKILVTQWLNDGYYPPIIYARYKDLLSSMSQLAQLYRITETQVNKAKIEFVLAPLLKCFNKQGTLKEHLQECKVFDEDRLGMLMRFFEAEV